jgi:hypothetical protein
MKNLLPFVDKAGHIYVEFESWLEASLLTATRILGISKSPQLRKLFEHWIMQMLHPDPTVRPTMGELLLRLMPVFEKNIKKEEESNQDENELADN